MIGLFRDPCRIIFCFLLVVFTGINLFLLPTRVYARVYFADDFSSGLEKWDYVDGVGSSLGSFRVQDEKLIGEVSRGVNSFLFTKNFTESDYVVELDVKNISGVDQELLLRVANDRSAYYLLDFRYPDINWPQDGNNITLWRFF